MTKKKKQQTTQHIAMLKRPLEDETCISWYCAFYSLEMVFCLDVQRMERVFFLLFLYRDRIKCEQAYYSWPEKCCCLLYRAVGI